MKIGRILALFAFASIISLGIAVWLFCNKVEVQNRQIAKMQRQTKEIYTVLPDTILHRTDVVDEAHGVYSYPELKGKYSMYFPIRFNHLALLVRYREGEYDGKMHLIYVSMSEEDMDNWTPGEVREFPLKDR